MLSLEHDVAESQGPLLPLCGFEAEKCIVRLAGFQRLWLTRSYLKPNTIEAIMVSYLLDP